MRSEPPISPEFKAGTSAAERVKQENRRDAPLGFSFSFGFHALFVVVFSSLAIGAYVASTSHSDTSTTHRVIIQTLVRHPQQAARVTSRPVNTRTAVTRQVPIQIATRAVAPRLRSQQVAVSRSAGEQSAKPARTKHSGRKGASKVATPLNGTVAAAPLPGANSVTIGPDNNGSSDDGADGPILRAGSGQVWSEQPPSGPLTTGAGQGSTDRGFCTPSRGGFFRR